MTLSKILRSSIAAALFSAALVMSTPGSVAAGAGGEIRIASHTPASSTSTGNAPSRTIVSSGDGKFLAFISEATDLVEGQSDGNGAGDVFLFDRASGGVTLVSHTPGNSGATSNAASRSPSISADGAFVTFTSSATNLVEGQSDANGDTDVFVFERATGVVRLVSHIPSSPTTTANAFSADARVSANGSFVVFSGSASDLVANQVEGRRMGDVFLYERATGAITLVSHIPGQPTTVANELSWAPSLSADGAFVVFHAYATNLVAGQIDANGHSDVFLFERATGTVSLVSHVPGSDVTTPWPGPSRSASLSADGALVVFSSQGPNLVENQADTLWTDDIFLFERATGTVTLVSHVPHSATTTANLASVGGVVIAANGEVVVFGSAATNLVEGQTDANGGYLDVYLFERATGSITIVSHDAGSTQTTANRPSRLGPVSADGGSVVFYSEATNLVPSQNDANNGDDVFVYQRSTGMTALVSHAAGSDTTTANGISVGGPVSADGNVVGFASAATNLVAGQDDTNGAHDVFAFRRTSGAGSPPPTDFDGDGDGDVAVFRPSGGFWFVKDGAITQFGTDGDIPVAGDYDGDGDVDVAVYRPSSGWWFVDGGTITAWGTSGDIPVPGDYDGDGDTDIAVFRPSSGVWFVEGGTATQFGTDGDIPVPGDYDGDGDTDIAVFRPSSGVWFVQGGASAAGGTSGDIPVPGDYDGDGDDDFAVFRPSNGLWFVQGGVIAAWGTNGDIPIPGDYDGNGTTEVAVFRPSSGTWFIQSGPTVGWGTSGDVPLPLPDAIRRFFFPPL